MVMESIANSVEEIIADVIQIGYTTAKEVNKALIFPLVERAIIDISQLGRFHSFVLRKLEKLTKIGQFLNVLEQCLVSYMSANQFLHNLSHEYQRRDTNAADGLSISTGIWQQKEVAP